VDECVVKFIPFEIFFFLNKANEHAVRASDVHFEDFRGGWWWWWWVARGGGSKSEQKKTQPEKNTRRRRRRSRRRRRRRRRRSRLIKIVHIIIYFQAVSFLFFVNQVFKRAACAHKCTSVHLYIKSNENPDETKIFIGQYKIQVCFF